MSDQHESWLEAWTVPEMPHDMKERVMSQMDEQWTLVGPPNHQPPPASSGISILTLSTAGAALIASAAAIVITLLAAEDPQPPPTPAAAPIVVADAPARSGQLTISVDPPAAICRLDGVQLDGASPYIATDITPGDHELVVELDGYHTWTRTVSIPGQQLHVPVVLQPEPHPHHGPNPAGKRVPRVRSDEPRTKGPLGKEVIRKVVRANLNDVRRCYNQGLVRDPELAGRVTVQFTISPTGKVPVTVLAESTISDRDVANCIVNAVKRWEFPKPEGGENVVVTYPFVLQPG